MSHAEGFLAVVNDAKSRIKEISIEEFKSMLQNNKLLTIVDVREDSEWQNGIIPNAMHLGRGIIERDIEKTIPNKNETLLLYCGGGYRSALAADSIQKMGYKNVYSLDGGYQAWKNS